MSAWEQFFCCKVVHQCHLLALKLLTSKVVQGKWPFHGFQYLASFTWFRRECVNHVTPGIKESVVCVCGSNPVILTFQWILFLQHHFHVVLYVFASQHFSKWNLEILPNYDSPLLEIKVLQVKSVLTTVWLSFINMAFKKLCYSYIDMTKNYLYFLRESLTSLKCP